MWRKCPVCGNSANCYECEISYDEDRCPGCGDESEPVAYHYYLGGLQNNDNPVSGKIASKNVEKTAFKKPINVKYFWSACTAIGLIFIYIFISSPGGVVIESTGNIDGLTNEFRLLLQGDRFWRGQLKEIEENLQWELSEPERMAEVERTIREVDKDANEIMEDLYRENPTLRPSPASREANALRRRADRIEEAQMWRMLEEHRLERVEKLRAALRYVKSKT